jgi:superfamily II DNA or RNA helicase
MLKLEDIRKDAAVQGVEPGQVVRIVQTETAGPNALTVYYKTADGRLHERMLFRSDETNLSLAEAGRPWAFDADGEGFKLATEAYRINVAYLFDPMMAVHTANVEPLPHQISAVYEAMLPRQPLRFVLADDPGAGKTIMAGLLIRELVLRADAKRVLIVSPGSLVEQWRDELYEKFGLVFTVFNRPLLDASVSGNPFEDHDQLIVRLDQLSRNEELQEKIKLTQWDLVVVDEAHKLSARWFGGKLDETKRFKLGKLLGSITRHFLLMTATPHNGKEEDFQTFLSLLDSDRFYGKFRDGAHKVDVSDLMRRMVKEEILKFDGTRLFPERRAYTVAYELSDLEQALYQEVTDYVKEGMNRADRLADGKRKGAVGFALTALQRRLASSPEAIYQSIKRRRARLKRRIEEEKLLQRGRALAEVLELPSVPGNLDEAADDLLGEEFENLENELVDLATAASTILELEAEVLTLEQLEERARQVVASNQDRKWAKLSEALQNTPEMYMPDGRRRKLIIFTEHRDTLNYLAEKLRGLLGTPEAVVLIHGGTNRDERRKVQEQFRNDPDVLILVATDAAGEGVNLQNANLMVNYDLPWNPNRLEQRFGRIHRIGQTQVCHLWNLLAAKTRESYVFEKLLAKLENESASLNGRVFDILGEVFEEKSLRELLIEAIRYGDDPERKLDLERTVEGALDTENIKAILSRNALCEEVMSLDHLYAVKEEMDKAEARKLQPYFVRSYFAKAFASIQGDMKPREPGRFEITHVPAIIRERDRVLTGRDRANQNPVTKRYARVCFEKQHLRVPGKPAAELATLLHPGHPLLQATTDILLEQHRPKLKQGAVLVNRNDLGTEPHVLFLIDHSVREGAGGDSQRAVSRRLQFITINRQGQAQSAGWAPHLDLEGASNEDLALVQDIGNEPWLTDSLERMALAHASQELVPAHFDEVRERRERFVDKTLQAVHERLVKEISYWSDRLIKTEEDVSAGKQPRVNIDNVRRTIDDLTARLEQRRKELTAQRHVVSATPVIVGGALVIPAGLLSERQGHVQPSADAEARRRIELLAMKAVEDAERALGHDVIDVSGEKCGWDITSRPPAINGVVGPDRHIEVKGRAKGQTTVTVTSNEIRYGFNQGDKFILAIVLVDGENVEGPFYVRRPFAQEPDWAVTSINLDLSELLRRAEAPHQTVTRSLVPVGGSQ